MRNVKLNLIIQKEIFEQFDHPIIGMVVVRNVDNKRIELIISREL